MNVKSPIRKDYHPWSWEAENPMTRIYRFMLYPILVLVCMVEPTFLTINAVVAINRITRHHSAIDYLSPTNGRRRLTQLQRSSGRLSGRQWRVGIPSNSGESA